MAQRRQIGQASDFYRCRVVEIVQDRPQPLDWRDDVLYREAPPPKVISATSYIVQIVDVDTSETHDIKSYASASTADKKKIIVERDLAELTRSQFASKYRMPST